jgi:hypothetical protein
MNQGLVIIKSGRQKMEKLAEASLELSDSGELGPSFRTRIRRSSSRV